MRLQPAWFKTEPVAAKVPEVTALFWVVKISTTAAGEALSDWFGTKHTIKWGFWIDIFMFLTALYLQFAARRYSAWTVLVPRPGHRDRRHRRGRHDAPRPQPALRRDVAVLAHRARRVSSTCGTAASTRSISTRITTNRREKYYWAVVFATFCLGTAVGDFAATTLGLGYLASAAFFCGVILIPWVGWKFLNWNAVFAFWFAYVITRPIGASFADYLSKGHDISGANFGNWQTALLFTAVVVGLVAYTAKARYDIQPELQATRSNEVAGGPAPEPS